MLPWYPYRRSLGGSEGRAFNTCFYTNGWHTLTEGCLRDQNLNFDIFDLQHPPHTSIKEHKNTK